MQFYSFGPTIKKITVSTAFSCIFTGRSVTVSTTEDTSLVFWAERCFHSAVKTPG